MSYYEVKVDNQSVFDASDKYLALINSNVNLQLGAAGSADLTFPPYHVFYDTIIPYGSNIEIFEDGKSIFFGRALPPSIDFMKNKSYHCEGALAFLNDIILPESDIGDTTCGAWLKEVIDRYNSSQTLKSRRIYLRSSIDGGTDAASIIGTNNANKDIYDLSINYESCFDLILNGIHKYIGGYFFTYRFQGKTYLDWVNDQFGEDSNQEVVFKVNLLDLMQSGRPFYTAVLPEGIEDSEGKKPLFTNYITMSNDIIKKYGLIVCHKQFPYTKKQMATITGLAKEFLRKQQINGYSFEVHALDQHIVDGDYDQFQIMQNVRIVSEPHAVDTILPITKLQIDLNTPIKKVTIGTPEGFSTINSIKKIKRDVKQNTNNNNKNKKKLDAATGSSKGVLESPDGNKWQPTIDDNGNMSYVKVPIKIFYSKTQPYWNVGDTFDLSKFAVMAQYGDGTTKDITDKVTYNIEERVFGEDEAGTTLTLTATYDLSNESSNVEPEQPSGGENDGNG